MIQCARPTASGDPSQEGIRFIPLQGGVPFRVGLALEKISYKAKFPSKLYPFTRTAGALLSASFL
jgi:hypothetical protein